MDQPILVTGGTGTLGRALVPRLVDAGHTVRVLSRSPQRPRDGVEYFLGDMESGQGIDAAVSGVETVIHGAGSAKGDSVKAGHLVDSLIRAGEVRHLVYISVVGADTTPFASRIDRATLGYFEEKRKSELIIANSGIPFTTLRATQFHDFIAAFSEMGMKLPVIPSFAGFSYQPVDVREVAERLVELSLGEASGFVPAIGGPRIYPMEDLVRSCVRATGHRRLILPMHIPGKAAKAQRDGANLAPDRTVGRRTFEEFLIEKQES